jgi:hypothetical protein
MVSSQDALAVAFIVGIGAFSVFFFYPEIQKLIETIQHPESLRPPSKGLFADNPIVGRGVDERLSLPKINIPTSRVVANAAFIHDLSTEE